MFAAFDDFLDFVNEERMNHLAFDDSILVFRVAKKIFGLCNIQAEELSVNLKCQPDYA